MFLIDIFTEFIYNHPLIRKIFMYILYTLIGMMVAIITILYLDTGYFIFSFNVFFNPLTYKALLDNHRNTIYMLIVLEQFLFIGVLLYQNNRLKNRSNCSVKYVHIEDIAGIWLQNQRIRQNIIKEVQLETKKEQSFQQVKPPLFFNFKKQRSNELFNNIINPHIDKLLDEEVEIIIELIKLIEDKGIDTPSVVSFTDKDPETKYKKDILTEDGLTSYQILRKVSLYDHTLNVVDTIYEELKRHSKTNYVLLLGKSIIAALAHDIGKINKMEEKLENVSPEIFSSQPHHQISKIFFMKMYPNYRDRKIVIEAIENHHAIKIPTGNDLIKLLISADKGARDFEIDEFFKSDGSSEKLIVKREKKQVKLNDKTKEETQEENNENIEVIFDANNGSDDAAHIKENKVLKEELAKAIIEKRLIEDNASKCHLTRAFTRATYDKEIEQYFKTNKETLALCFIDADKFKTINDTYGHHIGDEVLKHMVDTMFKTTRENNGIVYRYGGEEFLILFPTIQKVNLIIQLEKLRMEIENSVINIDDKSVKYTISIGAAFAKDFKDPKELAKKADELVYQAKEQGRNRVIVSDENINDIKNEEIKEPEPDTEQQVDTKKKKIVTLNDIDISDDFADMMNENKKPEKPKEEKKVEKVIKEEKPQPMNTSKSSNTPKQTNIDFSDIRDYESEEIFNIEEYENKILEELKSKINKSKSRGFSVTYHSISYKDMILFSFNTVMLAIENAIGYEKNTRAMTIHFIREYRKRGDIGYIDIENNYSTSKFYIDENGNITEFDAVPIFARIFNMNENDLLQLKLSDNHTKDAKVLTSNEVNE